MIIQKNLSILSKEYFSTIICVFVGAILLTVGLENHTRILTIIGGLVISVGVTWWPMMYFVKGIKKRIDETDDSHLNEEDSKFWLSRGLYEVGRVPFRKGKPLLEFIGITYDPVFEGTFVLSTFSLVGTALLIFGADLFDLLITDVGLIWVYGVGMLLLYFIAKFPRHIFGEYKLFNKKEGHTIFSFSKEKNHLNNTSKWFALIFVFMFLFVIQIADYNDKKYPSEFYGVVLTPIQEKYNLNVDYPSTFVHYIFFRIPLIFFGIISGVLLAEILALFRILAKLDKDDKNIFLNPNEAEPTKKINQILLSFWKASSGGIGFIPIAIMLISKNPNPHVVDTTVYLTLAYTALLSLTFPYALFRISSIVSKAKESTINILKNDPKEFEKILDESGSKNNKISDIDLAINDIRRIRDVPYKNIVLQSLQIMLAVFISLIGLGKGLH